MKTSLLMIATFFLSVSLSGQNYAKVLDKKMTIEDLEYMPLSELRLLKNELIKTKGKKVQSTGDDENMSLPSDSALPLDSVSQANVNLINSIEIERMKQDSVFTRRDLFKNFIKIIDHKEELPFYLQVQFLNACQSPDASIYLVPASYKFYTVAVSLKPMIGPEFHKITTLDLKGNFIDFKSMNGKVEFKEKKFLHESYNSLIIYTYTLNEEGKFDKKTPTKER